MAGIAVLIVASIPEIIWFCEPRSRYQAFSLSDWITGQHTPLGIIYPIVCLLVFGYCIWSVIGLIADIHKRKAAAKNTLSLLCGIISVVLAVLMTFVTVFQISKSNSQYTHYSFECDLQAIGLSDEEIENVLADFETLGLYDTSKNEYGFDRNCEYEINLGGGLDKIYIHNHPDSVGQGAGPLIAEMQNGHIFNLYFEHVELYLIQDGKALDNPIGRIRMGQLWRESGTVTLCTEDGESYSNVSLDQYTVDNEKALITMQGVLENGQAFSATMRAYTEEEMEELGLDVDFFYFGAAYTTVDIQY